MKKQTDPQFPEKIHYQQPGEEYGLSNSLPFDHPNVKDSRPLSSRPTTIHDFMTLATPPPKEKK